MKAKLVLKTKFDSDTAYVVLVNGSVITVCSNYSDAVWLANSYRGMYVSPDVRIRGAVVKNGEVFMN